MKRAVETLVSGCVTGHFQILSAFLRVCTHRKARMLSRAEKIVYSIGCFSSVIEEFYCICVVWWERRPDIAQPTRVHNDVGALDAKKTLYSGPCKKAR